jgi:hypothetical protein
MAVSAPAAPAHRGVTGKLESCWAVVEESPPLLSTLLTLVYVHRSMTEKRALHALTVGLDSKIGPAVGVLHKADGKPNVQPLRAGRRCVTLDVVNVSLSQ